MLKLFLQFSAFSFPLFQNTMKKTYLSLLILSGLFLTFRADAQVKIGNNGTVIEKASILELESTDKGLLIPRMANTTAIDALAPPVGMLIYITTEPSGLYIKKTNGWEHLAGGQGGSGNFSSLNISGNITANSFTGLLNGNATSANTALTANASTNSAVLEDLSTPNPVYPTFVHTTPGNAQLRTSTTKLSFRPNTGILTAVGFNGNLVGNVTGNATSSTNSTNASNTDIVNEVNSAAVHYPTFVSSSSGNLPQLVSNTGLRFVPLTGALTANSFNGALNGNATSATNVTGVVSVLNGGTGASTKGAAFDALSPMTTAGDLVYMSPFGTATRLPVGIPNTFLRTGAAPSWTAVDLSTPDVTGILTSDKGGTGFNNASTLQLTGGNIVINGDGAGSNVTLPATGTLAATFSPAFLGIPTAPTAAAFTNSQQLATTAFVTAADNLKANLASPAFSGAPTAPTAPTATDDTQIATTEFVNNVVGMIKAQNIPPNPPFAVPGTGTNAGELEITYAVNGSGALGTVVASPRTSLPPNLSIMWARCSDTTGVVIVRYKNFSATPINAGNLNLTVILP